MKTHELYGGLGALAGDVLAVGGLLAGHHAAMWAGIALHGIGWCFAAPLVARHLITGSRRWWRSLPSESSSGRG